MQTRDPYIALVGKIVGVVEVLRDNPDGLALQMLADRTGYVKSSVHRILQSLRHHGYVQQNEIGGRYRLGLKFLAMSRAVNGGLSFVQLAQPYIGELHAAFQETVYLAVLRGDRGVFVEVQETSRDLRVVGPLGAEVHFHATAAGKSMAAVLPADARDALLAALPLPKLTPRTITSRSRVNEEWARVRRAGVAINREETITGAIFLAAPLFDARRDICGAVSVGVPKARFSAALGRAITVALKSNSARLSETLALAGYVHQSAWTGDDGSSANNGNTTRKRRAR
jgi:IclR family transcriptional regulator, KDG regulon repressor